MLNSLDYIDSFIWTKINQYMETMLIRLSFYWWILSGDILIEVESNAMDDEEEDEEG